MSECVIEAGSDTIQWCNTDCLTTWNRHRQTTLSNQLVWHC